MNVRAHLYSRERVPSIDLEMEMPPEPTPKRLSSLLPAGAALPLLAAILACISAWALAPPRAAAFGVPIQTGMDVFPAEPEKEVRLEQVLALGARYIRLELDWEEIAPATPPAGFNASSPEDPAYNWGPLDRAIEDVVAHGLTPFIDILNPPVWAQSPFGAGQDHPDPTQLAMFAHAMAARYNGSRPGLPWIRYWEAWNEPNASYFLNPQLEGGRFASVEAYRALVNDFSDAVHEASAEDVVIAGELFPNGVSHSDVTAIAPLEFTRRVLCLSPGARPRRVCNTQVRADVWSVHPYTTGGPSTRPANPNAVWIYNLQALTNVVTAAQRLGTLVSRQPVQMWVTEFSWTSNPPDPKGVPVALEQRWVAEDIYRSWSAGYSLFSWFSLRDLPGLEPFHKSGLYFECTAGLFCDMPKPAGLAFQFPFVAFVSPRRQALVWGRTPAGSPGRVNVQWLQGHSWRTLSTLTTDSDGIFTARLRMPRKASARSALLRAVELNGTPSPSFSLHHPPDIIVAPFGS